jgi:hypothetical protein
MGFSNMMSNMDMEMRERNATERKRRRRKLCLLWALLGCPNVNGVREE